MSPTEATMEVGSSSRFSTASGAFECSRHALSVILSANFEILRNFASEFGSQRVAILLRIVFHVTQYALTAAVPRLLLGADCIRLGLIRGTALVTLLPTGFARLTSVFLVDFCRVNTGVQYIQPLPEVTVDILGCARGEPRQS